MRFSWIFSLVALAGTALSQSQINVGAILQQIPPCTQQCSLQTIAAANCALDQVSSCLCTNATMLRDLSICVLSSCNLTEQFVSTKVLQEQICEGAPKESRSAEIIRAIVILTIITYPIMILRMVSRAVIAQKVWWDDWMIVAIMILTVPMIVFQIFNASRGFGEHFWDVPPENLPILRKLYYIQQLLYVVLVHLPKLSILFLYLRIFINKRFRLWVKISMALLIVNCLLFLFLIAFQCVPPQSIFDVQVPGKCMNYQAIVYAGAAICIVEDVALILLPIMELKELNLSKKKKIALGFMFAVGSFAVITSILRLKFIVHYGNTIDVTWDNTDVAIWSNIEIFSSNICACLMCIRPLILKVIPEAWHLITKRGTSENTSEESGSKWSKMMNKKLNSKSNGLVRLGGDGSQASIKEFKNEVWVMSSASVELDKIEKGEVGVGDKQKFGSKASVETLAKNGLHGPEA